MRKILSIFAATLFAVGMMAQSAAVVLPATLDVSNVSFRSEGMPDFVLEEGDYAGTYFDMGAHDSSNDTLLYAEWDVTIQPIKYNVAVDVYNTNSWTVQLYLLNQAGDTLKDLRYKGHSGEKGQFAVGIMDLSDLAAGDYKLRARAATAWSQMKLKDVVLEANYAGVAVDLPGTLLPAYAELSANASITNNAIAFKPSTANSEYATWNVSFAEAGTFNVTIDITASNGHNYGVALLSADGATEIGAVSEGSQQGDTGVKELGAITIPAAGSYIVKLTNATQWSEAVLNSITFAVPAPAHTYTVAGSSTDLFGTAWSPAVEANDMVLQEDNTYKWEKTDLTLAAGTIEFKVCEDHAWTNCWPAQNYVLNIAESGIYTISIFYNPNDNNYVGALATKTGEAVVIPTVAMHGNFLGSWADTENFTIAEGDATASLTLTLAEGNYEFGMRIGGAGNWTANGVAFTRENNAAEVVAGQGNLTLAADLAGEYTFTWTYATNNLAITFPAAAPADPFVNIVFGAAKTADELAENEVFTAEGSEFSATIYDSGNKMAIDSNACRFGTAEAYQMYRTRLKSGGASGSDKNYLSLNIPEAGTLRIAPRTGSNSATDRALIVIQGGDTLYNQIVQESQAIEVQEGENTVKVYPYVDVTVAAGSVIVRYSGAMNFYAFAFKAEETPQPVNPIFETYFATGDGWVADTESNAVWDAAAQKVTVNIALDKVAQWQAQVKYQALPSEPAKFYHFGVKMKANNAVSGIIVKWDDNTGLVLKEGVALEADTEYVIDMPMVASNAAGNGLIVFDFGYAKAGDVIEIYDVVVEEVAAPVVDLVDGYYLIGLNGWSIYDLAAADKFEANPEEEGEYMLTAALAANAEFKVVSVANNELVAWYPAEAGNYVVDLAHAGEAKAIYFRPDYQGGEGWHAGCIFVAENEAPVNPIDHTYFATGSGWGEDTESNAVWDEETGKITVTLALEKVAPWQGQVFVNAVKAEPGKCYNFSVKMKANKNMSGVTIKWQENNNDPIMVSEINTISLVADEEFVYTKEQIAGVDGNGMVCYDFGFAEAGTIVEIYDLVIEETECPAVDAQYYLVGTITNWTVVADDAHLFVATENEGEYKLHFTLAEGNGIKVVAVEGESQTWYPDGEGNEYVVDAAHAGEKDILFRPAGNPEWAAFGGYIYIEANQGIDNTAVDVKAVKMIENGQLFIELNGVRYNVTGARVR